MRWCCESAALNMTADLENSAVATGLEKLSFHSNPKERQCQKCSNYRTIAFISHTRKVMLKILQARLQQYVNPKLPDVPACASSSPAFLMMYSAYELNKQGDNIQPWRTPFPIWNRSVLPCPVLTVASWPAYRFLKRQVRCSGIPISFRISYSLLWSTQSKALA